MRKFSASYGGTKENFIVKVSCGDKVSQEVLALFSVVENILQRGTPTPPSEFLKKILGKVPDAPTYLVDNSPMNWKNIKGDDEKLDFPARTFYKEILPAFLDEYAFAKNLLLPEAEFADVLEQTTTFNGQQMDFYLPQAKTVFEIDGASHDERAQAAKDKRRDFALKREGNSVIRIKSFDVKNLTDALFDALENFKTKLSQNPLLEEYKTALEVQPDDIRVRYDAVIRLQLALLTFLKVNAGAELKIKIVNSDVDNLAELLKIAHEDLKLWLENVAQLAKINFTMPALTIADEKNSFALDFCMFRRYTDADELWSADAKKIYVRTDYFPAKNYYRVASADSIKYKFTADAEELDNAALIFLLKNLFGHDEFRTGQIPIIKHILTRNDTIGILPTGTGKSLCYQLTALLQPGLTLVVVPLISLMQDQLRGMDRNGINRATYISGAVQGEERERRFKKFMDGQYQFMLISPERTQNQEFRESLQKIELNFTMAVVDEVHCLSEWGHDFRVSYLRLIPTIKKFCAKTCLLGLTATASQAVLNDIKAEFENDGRGIKALSSMDRPELEFQRITVKTDFERDKKILELIAQHSGQYTNENGVTKNSVGLIFCLTKNTHMGRPAVNHLVKLIADNFSGSVEKFYSDYEDKVAAQERFMDENFSGVMVCTTAFGMGIDKENIKFTINSALPKSIEEFYQQAGRAGRDADKSVKSHCYILYQPETVSEETVNKIFDINTEIGERKILSEKIRTDLGTVMFFWNLSRDTVSEEYENILKVLEDLKAGNTTLKFGERSLVKIQNVLYKLTLLGIVRDWTVEYFDLEHGELDADYAGVELEAVERSLLQYIHKYDAEFTFDERITRYKKYQELRKKFEPLKSLIYVLLTWVNDNILYGRLQSIRDMRAFCSPKISDAEFRQKINDFFKYTEQVVTFDAIVENPRDYSNWFKILMTPAGEVINHDAAQSTATSLLRYLESYGHNTGLNYLSGMLRLICGEYAGTEGEWRLADSLKNIHDSMNSDAYDKIISQSLEIAVTFDEQEKNMFSEALLKIFPDRDVQVHSALQDMNSFAAIVDRNAVRLRKILEESIHGLRKKIG